MKRIASLLIALLLGLAGLQAQQAVFVQGVVSGGGAVLPGVPVVITLNNGLVGIDSTDSNGFYSITIPGVYQGGGSIYAFCPSGFPALDSFFVTSNQILTLNLNCGAASVCNAQFSHQLTAQGGMGFHPLFPLNGASYLWSFGDGSSSTQPQPVHAYTASGVYTVCLTVFDSAINCQATWCDTVVVQNAFSCSSFFSAIVSPSDPQTYNFVNQSTGSSPNQPLLYQWHFGDSIGSSTLANPSYTYPQPGTYFVCLNITDTLTGCTDIFCDLIFVGSAACDPTFNWTEIPGGPVVFQPVLQPGTASHFWNFGDGNTSTQNLPLHTYAAPGSYIVCHSIIDSLNNCQATWCDTVTIAGGGGSFCHADFIWFPDSLNPNGVQFINLSQPGNTAQYSWSFGDGSTSSQANPSHVYAAPGIYTVCLAMTTATPNGQICADTTCIVVQVQASVAPQILGFVYKDSLPPLNAVVYLIQHDSLTGTLSLVDSAFISPSGIFPGYAFPSTPGVSLQPGDYLVKAALLPGDPDYAAYLPTYFGDELFWSQATSVVLSNGPVVLTPISLLAGNNPGGPGFIGGLVSQGANKTEGDPMSNVSVLLTDANDAPVAHTLTAADGSYAFANLAYGTYHVHVEMLGKYGDPHVVVLAPGNGSHNGINFEVTEFFVNAVTTGIEELGVGELRSIYPNPAREAVNIEVELSEASALRFRLLTPAGQELRSEELPSAAGLRALRWELGGLPQGLYFIEVQSGQGKAVSKLFILP